MRFFFLISTLFFLGTKFPGINCQEDEFYNFLYNAGYDFPSWIAQNVLDPTPVIPEELSLEYTQGPVNISAGKIWNQVMSGHSGGIYNLQVFANLHLRNFFVRLNLSDFIVTSEYEVEGTVLSSIPITGTGKVTLRSSYQKFVELNVHGFELTPEGYINISAGSVEPFFYFNVGPVSFEGLSAGGYETEVEGILRGVYKRQLRDYEFYMFQMTDYFRSYMEELFEKTPISEIIGTTLPPINTHPTDSPVPSTEGPCCPPTEPPVDFTTEGGTPGLSSHLEAPYRSSVFKADGSTLLEEKVLQKIVTVKENGEKVGIVENLVKFEKKLKD